MPSPQELSVQCLCDSTICQIPNLPRSPLWLLEWDEEALLECYLLVLATAALPITHQKGPLISIISGFRVWICNSRALCLEQPISNEIAEKSPQKQCSYHHMRLAQKVSGCCLHPCWQFLSSYWCPLWKDKNLKRWTLIQPSNNHQSFFKCLVFLKRKIPLKT